MNPRIVFMGSPDFAVPILKSLAVNYGLLLVVTQPDKPAGRGKVMQPPPVKVEAQKLGIGVIQPQKLSEPDSIGRIKELSPELIVVAAYGQILKPDFLYLPKFGCLNIHASLLPRWRGASPISAAILAGDKKPVSASCKWMRESILG